jgi:hypothetical protein
VDWDDFKRFTRIQFEPKSKSVSIYGYPFNPFSAVGKKGTGI